MKGLFSLIDETMFRNEQTRESAVDGIVNRFRELISERKLRPGNLVPSESILAEQMNVSRGSVREAMKILSALGVVDIRRGDGTYISHGIGHTLLDPFLLRLMLNDYDLGHMREFREMIEFDVVRAILRNKDAQGIGMMRKALDLMQEEADGIARQEKFRWVEMDIAFHKAMGRATGNALIEQLYEFILKFFEPSIQETYNHPDNIRQAFAYHKAIMSAVERGDEAAALRAVADSVAGWVGKEDEQ
jgi:GntR family transcriptional repressor for pyruvate dehydrogenase complex